MIHMHRFKRQLAFSLQGKKQMEQEDRIRSPGDPSDQLTLQWTRKRHILQVHIPKSVIHI